MLCIDEVADAEGNGDSISQAVQAERIALLTNILNQTESSFPHPLQRRASMPLNTSMHPAPPRSPFPTQAPRHAAHASLGGHAAYGPSPALRSRSQADLRGQYQSAPGRPIYQTPAQPSRNSSPARSSYGYGSRVPSPTAAFLPACLQDVVNASPLHSSPATSASSASLELAFDDFGYEHGAPAGFGYGYGFDGEDDAAGESEEEVQFRAPGGATRSGPARKTPEASIWSLDGEESRTLRPYAPIHADCMQDLAGRLASLTTA